MSMSETERLAREQMSCLAPGQLSHEERIERSRADPALRDLWGLIDKVESGILELQADTKRREYKDNPGLCEAEARAIMDLPEVSPEEHPHFPHVMHRLSYAIDWPEDKRPVEDSQVNRGSLDEQPTAEDIFRREMGLPKVPTEEE